MNRIGLPSLLFLVFLVLKLTSVIDWSWWWVTAPLWIPASIALVATLFGVAAAIFLKVTETPGDRAAKALRNYGKSFK